MGNYQEIFPPNKKRKWVSTGPKNSKYEDWGMCKGSQSNSLVLSGPTKLLNYHRTWNESKETNFRQIIKPLSFMTQSQWKLPSLCLRQAAGEKKEQTWGNKGTIMELEPVCGPTGTSVHVRHHSLVRYGRSAIPEPNWVQIKSCFIIWMAGEEWAGMASNLFGGNIWNIQSGSVFPLSWVHLVNYF